MPGGAEQAPALTREALFAQLASAEGAGITVITPNLRLAQELQRAYDANQLACGLEVWSAPDLLPWTAFVSRLWEVALYSEAGMGLPQLLTAAQEQALWEEIVRGWDAGEGGDGLLAVPEAAAAARDAWKTAHGWNLMPALRDAPLNEDAQAWTEWARRYERDTRRAGLVEAARLPGLLAAQVASVTSVTCVSQGGDGSALNLPRVLVAYGFDLPLPQQEVLFEALRARGCRIERCSPVARAGRVLRLPCLDAREEIARASHWARARLEANPQARIGVVVPGLSEHRHALRRAFTRVMAPALQLPGAPEAPPPFNISLGEPLTAWPLVDAALAILELAGRELEFERVSRLLRSPFIAQADAEMTRRARLDAALRERAEPVLSLDRLLTLMARESSPRAAVLSQRLTQLSALRKERLFAVQSPLAWARGFSEALDLMGFPGERGLDSAEHQTHAKWLSVLAGFAQLEQLIPRMGYAQALSRLRRMANDEAFQPESHQEPVQVIGVLESAGTEFDHLWVMGLSDEAWPLAARPNPFLPLTVLRAAGVPEASAEAALALDRRITQGWLAAADEVVLSHPVRDGDRDLQPSPLVAALAEGMPTMPEATLDDWRARIHAAGAALDSLETLRDDCAPPLSPSEGGGPIAVRGGAQVLKDQAACPFRAYAVHRLGASGLQAPHTGLDAMERGSLVHQVLAQAWKELETQHALLSIAAPELQALLARAAAQAIAHLQRDRPTVLGGRFGAVEAARLARLAAEWLDMERGRTPFGVFATEDKRTLELGGLQFSGRLDRVDETAEGQRIVIDYKTGKPTATQWLGERMDEPQLPLYLVASEPQARSLAFAQVRAGEMKFISIAADKDILPKASVLPVKRWKSAPQTWEAQLAAWRSELERMARAHAAGEAQVDPKPRACDFCDQAPLCRIHTKRGWEQAETEADAASAWDGDGDES
jgi:ATP-dependent helicase/nuclease subunit B